VARDGRPAVNPSCFVQGQAAEAMNPRHRARADEIVHAWTAASRAGLRLAAALVLCAWGQDSASATPLEFPSAPSGRLEISYPLDETLFPPEIVAPTFVWSDETEGVDRWLVLLRFDAAEELLRFPTSEPRWRPSAEDWSKIKRRREARDAEVAIVGVGPGAQATSSASVRIRTSSDPVGDSIFYREVPLPFIDAVQDPSRIRWRFGSVDSEAAPPIVLENLPVCGNSATPSRATAASWASTSTTATTRGATRSSPSPSRC
jgi:hypothetical protein